MLTLKYYLIKNLNQFKVSHSNIKALYRRLASDQRITVWHISLYGAILYLWDLDREKKTIRISRNRLMTLAHFGSIVTYHKCIKQLVEYEYIKYSPSYDCYAGSSIELL
jgi:hypothetical protein